MPEQCSGERRQCTRNGYKDCKNPRKSLLIGLSMYLGCLLGRSGRQHWSGLRSTSRTKMVADYRLLDLPNGHALLLGGVQLFRKQVTSRNPSACRPRSNLPPDRRHIHAIYRTHAARKMEFLDDWLDLGVSISGSSFEAGMSASAGA